MSFQRAVANVLKNEGGLVDNPLDPGGRTNRGITQRTLDSFRERHPELSFPMTVAELTLIQTQTLYLMDYWTPIHGDELPDAVSFALLDWAVNSGVQGAIQGLQRSLGIVHDGIMGPMTVAACGYPGVVTALSVERIYTLTGLKSWTTFGKGWATRVINTAVEAFEP